MDDDQRRAFELATSGHNLIITGQAGTGKTFLVKQIVRYLRQLKKNVAIVCSTGIAATHYGELRAQTLHKWAGIEDGRHLNEEIIHLVKTDERFNVAKKNIENAEILIIDEISMISAKILHQVQLLCKNVRNSKLIFGNIQVILVGDFYQLPPISNEHFGDLGNHCYRLPWFENYFPHKINLNIIHRQEDQLLIQCINELEIGNLSEDCVAFLLSLDRPIQNEKSCVHLFARNLDVDLYNYNKLQALQGELKVYKAEDEGSQHYLNKFLAPKNLGLKLGCPVMLIKNLSDTLVNGLCGTVTNLCNDSVDVKFMENHSTPITVSISREIFTIFDPVDKIVLAKRVQMPLKVGFAMTIHKSQGMTLKNLVIDCTNCIQPGQLGVAIGRAVSVQGLKVINFHKNLCKKHPGHVYNFYDSFSIGIVKCDLSCCRDNVDISTLTADTGHKSEDTDDAIESKVLNEDSEFSDSEIEELEFIDNILSDPGQNALPDQFSQSKLILDSAVQKYSDTPVETIIFSFRDAICKSYKYFDDWFHEQFSIMEDIGLNTFPEGEMSFSQKHRNDYFIRFNKYLNSDDYEKSAKTLLNYYEQNSEGPAFQLLTAVMFQIEKEFFLQLSSYLQLSAPEPVKKLTVQSDLEMDSAGKGKLRYISGYILAKLKHTLSKKIRNILFTKGKETELSRFQSQMEILNSLCTSFDHLNATAVEPETLLEVKHRQNDRESLTNVSDLTFSFFQKLELLCREKLTHDKLVDDRKYLFSSIKGEILDSSYIFDTWIQCVAKSRNQLNENQTEDISDLLSSMVMTCDSYTEIFQAVVSLFLKVNLSQFRRDFLTFLKKEKSVALRKKVMKRSKTVVKTFNMKFFSEDDSSNKEVSLLRLKSELLQNEKFFTEHSFTKKDLISICQHFNLKATMKQKKDDIIKVLVDGILENVHASNQSVLDTEQAGPSNSQPSYADLTPAGSVSSGPGLSPQPRERGKRTSSKGKGKGKGKGKKRKTSADRDLNMTEEDLTRVGPTEVSHQSCT